MNTENDQSEKKILEISKHQHLFIMYFSFILIDLTVLNLFDEYWDLVVIDSFTISLLTALLLQIMLKLTLIIEHKLSDYFSKKNGGFLLKITKFLSLWAVLFGSKFVILWTIDFSFGDEVLFLGPWHGIVSFIVVVVVMLLVEAVAVRINRFLGL